MQSQENKEDDLTSNYTAAESVNTSFTMQTDDRSQRPSILSNKSKIPRIKNQYAYVQSRINTRQNMQIPGRTSNL